MTVHSQPTLSLALAPLAIAFTLFTSPASAASISLTPVKDNTLIESVDGSASNALGDGIFCGRTGAMGGGTFRRSVLAFDLSAIPAGATITSATLTLTLQQSVSGDTALTLHRLTADWGEGTSAGFGGSGAPSTPGDATWLHTFFDGSFWTTPGGDYVAAPAASATVGFLPGPYTWTSAQLVADVADWQTSPATNFGWILIGNEVDANSAKRFSSREFVEAPARPTLTVVFDAGYDLDGDGNIGFGDLLQVLNNWGPCKGCPQDLNHDGDVGFGDLLTILNNWGPCS